MFLTIVDSNPLPKSTVIILSSLEYGNLYFASNFLAVFNDSFRSFVNFLNKGAFLLYYVFSLGGY